MYVFDPYLTGFLTDFNLKIVKDRKGLENEVHTHYSDINRVLAF